ncbi:MAG: hypothetical protein IJU96_05825, partial [Clostridia bacterium]|nr:hypothetical protein [Clostridia bacterium]
MKKLLAFLLALLPLLSSILPVTAADSPRKSVYSSYRIPTGSVRMVAHRGYSAVAPENTLPAFKLAGENGFWGAECDISPTADGAWVIMHDDTVDRTTNGEGKVIDFTLDELRALAIDEGNNVEQYPNTRVPLLTEYLDVCKAYGMYAVIEIKGCTPVGQLDSLAMLLSAREEKERFIIISFGREHCARMKELLPETPVYILIGGAPEEEFYDTVLFAVKHKLDGIDFASVWGEEQVKIAQKVGLKTMVWTVDDLGTVERYYRWGVRDVTTNSLTPAPPQGNVFQRLLWALRDA